MEEKKNNFVLPIVIVIVLLAAGYFLVGDRLMMKKEGDIAVPSKSGTEEGTTAVTPTPVAPVTGSVDDAVSAILSGASSDPSSGDAESADASAALLDTDAINSYADAYDDTGI